jgi:predicted ATP-grasp superfamily ATP-dependent carboligase
LANKVSFHALCNEAGIPIARSIVPHCIDDVRAFAASTEFPVVVKATEQWYLLQDRFSAKLIRNADELLEFYEGTIPEERHRLIIQEFVPGDDWISHGYYNSERNISLTFTGKKLRAYPAGAGSTASGISVGNASLRCETERFLRPLCYSGIFDIDWRKDSRDGVYKIVDCNPRIGQNFRMFENAAGIDVVRAQHLDLSGLRIEAADMIEGRLFIAESFWLQTLIRETPGKAPKPPVPRSSKELAWWSMYDPLPSAVMGIRLMIRILRRALGRWAAQRKASGAQRPGTHTHGIAH